MASDDETYEDFVKRYRAGQGQPAEGPKISSVNKNLAIMAVAFVGFYLMSSCASASIDQAVAEQEARDHPASHSAGSNPWSKD